MRNRFAIVILALLVAPYFSACEGVRKKRYTPEEFLSHVVVRRDTYSKDSTEILTRLKGCLWKHQDFFSNRAYFESTEILIDSIIYSANFSKLAVFVITKNPTYRQSMPDKKHEWYYDGTCYLGVRESDTLSLSWIGPSFSNSPDRRQLSGMLRDSYFTEFATRDTVGRNTYKYNLNDIRFWDCSIWEKIKADKVRKAEFEEEKKNHPENIYEPPER